MLLLKIENILNVNGEIFVEDTLRLLERLYFENDGFQTKGNYLTCIPLVVEGSEIKAVVDFNFPFLDSIRHLEKIPVLINKEGLTNDNEITNNLIIEYFAKYLDKMENIDLKNEAKNKTYLTITNPQYPNSDGSHLILRTLPNWSLYSFLNCEFTIDYETKTTKLKISLKDVFPSKDNQFSQEDIVKLVTSKKESDFLSEKDKVNIKEHIKGLVSSFMLSSLN